MSWRLRLSVETILRLTPAVLGSTVFSIAGLCAAHACLDDQALRTSTSRSRQRLATGISQSKRTRFGLGLDVVSRGRVSLMVCGAVA
jgi:hypothetical protein